MKYEVQKFILNLGSVHHFIIGLDTFVAILWRREGQYHCPMSEATRHKTCRSKNNTYIIIL
jgi:hypothetical protein